MTDRPPNRSSARPQPRVGRVALPPAVMLVLTFAAVAGADDRYLRAAIPHQDGSGRATIVEIPKGLAGAEDFVRDELPQIPARGEVIVPPRRPPAAGTEPQATTPPPARE